MDSRVKYKSNLFHIESSIIRISLEKKAPFSFMEMNYWHLVIKSVISIMVGAAVFTCAEVFVYSRREFTSVETIAMTQSNCHH